MTNFEQALESVFELERLHEQAVAGRKGALTPADCIAAHKNLEEVHYVLSRRGYSMLEQRIVTIEQWLAAHPA
jgi:hypothetical protein